MTSLQGVTMELEDCAFCLLKEVIPTTDPHVAFQDADVILLVGSLPRKEGMQRKELLHANASIFEAQGKAINAVAKLTTKILVVGNPANTNALIAQLHAPRIPAQNFSALTRLDENRAKHQLAAKLSVSPDRIKNVVIWGNHSNTQFPDATHALLIQDPLRPAPVAEALVDPTWLQTTFMSTVQTRGAAVLAARKLSSAMSAANAIADHMRDWWHGTPPGTFVSMAVLSDGSCYDVPTGLFYSFPVTIDSNGNWSIVRNLSVNSFAAEKMKATANELLEERHEALSFLKGSL